MTQPSTRTQKAAATRARLIECARTLFVTQGYAATTTREVAAAAHVTERTLFNVVPSKGELLREVLLTYVFTEDDSPLLQRQDFAPVLQAEGVETFLAQYSRWVSDLHRRTSVVAEMTRAAASVDPGAAEMWAWGNAQQIVDLNNLAHVLDRRHWLRPGLAAREVAQSFAVLSGHETYWRLVTDQQWSLRRYRRWLHRHCANEMISEGALTSGRGDVGPEPRQETERVPQ
jgi:AcrR family transcriptional regulator